MGKNNITTVLTLGTFDLPHRGHFKLLERAKALGDFLYVAINTDEFVEKYKGTKPILSLDHRATIIENSKFVDAVLVNEGNGATVIEKINPDFIVIGSDWLYEDYKKQINYNGKIPVIYVPRTDDISTTDIKARLQQTKP